MGHSGTRALSIFTRVLNARILRAHGSGALSAQELREKLGWAAKASLRSAIARLTELGALEREPSRAPSTRLTAAGRDLLTVAEALERWLSRTEFGALELPDPAARAVVRTLVASWDSGMIQALARRPRSLADLDAEIGEHDYPALKRRFAKLRGAALAASIDEKARSPRYEPTAFLRRAAVPLLRATCWERDHASGAWRPDARDLQASLLLALPLLELTPSATGSFVLAVTPVRAARRKAEPPAPMVELIVEEGRVESLRPSPEGTPKSWLAGSFGAWLDALSAGRPVALRAHGPDGALALATVEGLRSAISGGFC
jgi:DNA-binding HxlR family transcriptional regulator